MSETKKTRPPMSLGTVLITIVIVCLCSFVLLRYYASRQPKSSAPIAMDSLVLEIKTAYPEVPTISPQALHALLQQRAPLTLIDVRTEEEFLISHITGAQNTPLPNEALDKSPPDYGKIILYCSVGWRSTSVAQLLMQQGAENIFNLEGGIFAWVALDLPVVRDGQTVHEVHPYNRSWGKLLIERFHPHTYTPIAESRFE